MNIGNIAFCLLVGDAMGVVREGEASFTESSRMNDDTDAIILFCVVEDNLSLWFWHSISRILFWIFYNFEYSRIM